MKFWATRGLPSLRRWCTVGVDQDTPKCNPIQGVVTAERQPFVLVYPEVVWSWTWSERRVVVNILSTVGNENTYTKSQFPAVHHQETSSKQHSRIRLFFLGNSTFRGHQCALLVLSPCRWLSIEHGFHQSSLLKFSSTVQRASLPNE